MTYMFDNKQYVAVAAGIEHHRVWIALDNREAASFSCT